jgi:hypothetical protein
VEELFNTSQLVESMLGIIRGTSQLDPDMPVSMHPAPDILRELPFCSYGYNHDRTHGLLEGF